MIRKIALFFVGIVLALNAYGQQYVTQGINGSTDRRIVIGWDGSRPDYVSPSTQSIWNTSPYNRQIQDL